MNEGPHLLCYVKNEGFCVETLFTVNISCFYRLLFRSIVLMKLTYGLPIYVSLTPDLTAVQNFLQHCYKRKYISYQINIYDVLEKADGALFNKISSMPGHPLLSLKLKKVLRTLGFHAASCLGLIPSVLRIAFSTGSILNIKWQFNANIVFTVHDFLLSLIF